MADISIINKDNTDYNVKDAAGRLALAEVENKGAKNVLYYTKVGTSVESGSRYLSNGVRFTMQSDGSILVNRESSNANEAFCNLRLDSSSQFIDDYCNGQYVLSGSYGDCILRATNNTYNAIDTAGNGVVLQDRGSQTSIWVQIRVSASASPNNVTVKPMICTKAEWSISHQFEPHALPNPILTPALIEQVDNGAKNICNMSASVFDAKTYDGVTVTRNDETINVSNTSGNVTNNFFNVYVFGTGQYNPDQTIPPGQWVAMFYGSGTGIDKLSLASNVDSTITRGGVNEPVESTIPSDSEHNLLRLYVEKNTSYNCNLKIMICSKADWNISHKYVPYGKTNAELTVLTDEDRAALVEIVDGGSKNLLKNQLGSGTKSGLAYTTGTDGSIVITAGTATRGNADFVIPFTPTKTGQYVLQGCPDGGSGATYKGQIALYPSMENVVEIFDDTSATATLTGGTQYAYRFRVYNGKEIGDVTIYPMVCTEAAWKISQTFQPYAPTNRELYESDNVIDISNAITAVSGYTIESTTHLYYKNKQVFGTIAIAIDSGSYSSSQTAIAKISTKYAPIEQYLNMCGFSTSQWGITNVGYAYIQMATATSSEQRGQLLVKSPTPDLTHMILNVCYPTAT